MTRFLFASACCLLVLNGPLSLHALAQDEPAEAADGESQGDATDDGLPPEAPDAPPPSDEALSPTEPTAADLTDTPSAESRKGKLQKSWQDIVVLPRKIFLKRRRVELQPFLGTTVNDNLMQHTALGLEANYHITDILSVGVLGMFYLPTVLDQEFFTRYHFSLVPTLNKYLYTTTLNMAYVPIYGKFALFNYWILQYEILVTGGVGITGTEVIPRDQKDEAFNNIALTFPVGVGFRLFVNKWLAVQLTFRDYMMLDTFEKPGRTQIEADAAKADGEARFINNVIVNLGVSFFFPMSFHYTTFR